MKRILKKLGFKDDDLKFLALNFEPDDTDFMSELEAASNLRPTGASILLLYSIVGLILLGVIWASLSQVEQITRGSGQVVPSQEIQVVQSLEGGILRELLVREGELVEKGEVLLRISDVQFSSEERGTEARALRLRAKKARLTAEANGEDYSVPDDIRESAPRIAENERALFASRQKELASAVSILNDKITASKAQLSELETQRVRMIESRRLLKEELDITKQMVAKRAVPKLEEIRLQREYNDISGQIDAIEDQRGVLEAELASSEKERDSQLDKFKSQALGELNDVSAEISALEENLKSIGDRVDRAEVRAPVDGIVNNLAITTIGGVVEPAMPLVEIVPIDDELKIVAKVAPSEIAFIHPGQEVKVKVTAYDPQIYGSLPGTLERIGANSVTDREGNIFFEVDIRTEKNYLGSADRPLPITPGMVADIEVITGKRTILEYLLKPLLRARDRAFTER